MYCSNEIDQQIFNDDTTCSGSPDQTVGLDNGCKYVDSLDASLNIDITFDNWGDNQCDGSAKSIGVSVHFGPFNWIVFVCVQIIQ